jgi:hypothetical protein
MSTSVPTDQNGVPLLDQPVVRKSAARAPQRRLLDHSFAEAVKVMLQREKAARAQLHGEIAGLRAEVSALRGQLDTAQKLNDLQQRLDQLEAAPRQGLRTVA